MESLWSWIGLSDKQSSQQSDAETDSSVTAAAANTGTNTLSLTVHQPTPTRSSQRYGLDIHSCLQLLIDVYGSTLLPSQSGGPSVPITLFNETIRSVRSLTDCFSLPVVNYKSVQIVCQWKHFENRPISGEDMD